MTEIGKSVGFLLAKAYQRASAIFKEEFHRYELTPQQYAILAFLWQEDGLSQTELSNRSQIDRTTIGGLIDRLEEVRLVKRLPHPDDRRAYRISLTPQGSSLETELGVLAERARLRFISRLTASEHETLCQLLEKLRS